MSKQMIIRIDEKTKEAFSALARAEGKAAGQVVRELIQRYITERDLAGYIDQLWDGIGRTMTAKGFRAKDIPGVVRKLRAERL